MGKIALASGLAILAGLLVVTFQRGTTPSSMSSAGAPAVGSAPKATAGSVRGSAAGKAAPVAGNAYRASTPRPSLATRKTPSTLDIATLSPERRARLDARQEDDSDIIPFLTYKLGLLARFRECAGDADHGEIIFFINFDVDPATGLATGKDLELYDSKAPSEMDRKLIECAEAIHTGREMQRIDSPPGADRLHIITRIRFPLATDNAYNWFN